MHQIKHWSIPESPSSAQRVDVKDYLELFNRRKWIVMITFGLIVGTVTTVSLMLTPVYKATAQLIIGTKSASLFNISEFVPEDHATSDYFQTQYNLLRSRSLASMVIQDLDWHQSVDPDAAESNRSDAAPSFTNDVQTNRHQPIESDAVPGRPGLRKASHLVDAYLANLEITPVPGSRLVQVSFADPSAETAARVANAHARAFIEKSIETQHVSAQKALKWLKTQLQEQKDKVAASQQKVYEFNKVQDNIAQDALQDRVSDRLMDGETASAPTKGRDLDERTANGRLRALSMDQEIYFALPEIADDPIIQAQRQELVQLQTKRLEMAINYGPKHPKMLALESSIQQLNQEIEREVRRLSRTIEAEMDRDVLRREAETHRHFYDLLLKHVREISLASAIESSNVNIVDQAEVPRFPVKPKIILNILMSVILGLVVGAGAALFVEYADNSVKSPDDVINGLGMRVLGQIPFDKTMQQKTPPILPLDDTAGERRETPQTYALYDISGRLYSGLKATWQEASAGQAFLVESATMNEGKTTVLSNFAVNLAHAGVRVVMLDGDVQRPALHQRFGVQNQNGLAEGVWRVLTQDIFSGSLTEFSGTDLFFLAALKRLSGRLTVSDTSQTMVATFTHGRLLHLQNQNNPEANRLGQMLLKGGFISETQLDDAVARNRRTGLPLGYILINSGYVTADQLQGPLRLQVEEHLHKLFSWQKGTFAFEQAAVADRPSERVNFGEDYSAMVQHLSRTSDNRFLEREILSRLKPVNGSNLYLINAGKHCASLSGPLNISVLKRFIATLKRHFDIVLIDAPPLLESADGSALSTLTDGVIFVIKSGHLSLKKLQEAKSCLDETKASVVGAVLNQVKANQNNYYRHI